LLLNIEKLIYGGDGLARLPAGSSIWQDANAFNATQNEMIAQCVPNHQ